MIEIGAEVQGFKELEAKLKALPWEVGSKVLRTAVLTSAKPMLDEAKAQAPAKTGRLKKSIARRVYLTDQGTKAVVMIYIKPAAWYGRLVHQGVNAQRQRRGGKRHSVVIPANPFLRRAFDSQKDAYITLLKQNLEKGIARAIAKIGGRR